VKLVLLLLFVFARPAHADLVGTWKLTSYIYDGQDIPLPNPDLDLRFKFTSDGVSILHWYRHGENGFCERKATYDDDGSILHQKAFWIHPKNDVSCFSDPEMQKNSETFTPFHLVNGYLYLELSLADKPFIYVLSLLPDEVGL
jgi:hypothetical protein